MVFVNGQVIVRRETRDGAVFCGFCVRVVRDQPDLLAVFLSDGSQLGFGHEPYYSPSGRHPWNRGPSTTWQGNGVLMLQRPDESHAVWVFQPSPGEEVAGWYVNLQDPFRRTRIGVDSFDHELDLVVERDLRWRFKDVEAMPSTIELGRFTQSQADAVWVEGCRVGEMLDAGTPWWLNGTEGWAAWRPPPRWCEALSLPKGWREVPVDR